MALKSRLRPKKSCAREGVRVSFAFRCVPAARDQFGTYTADAVLNGFVGGAEAEGVGYGAGPGACELGGGAACVSWARGGGERRAYSFAKTPLKAAQAPLAMARVSQRGERDAGLAIVIEPLVWPGSGWWRVGGVRCGREDECQGVPP